jgi:alpha-L-fucosidase 2
LGHRHIYYFDHRASSYIRWLDLDTALAGSSYGMPDGSTVNKTSFCSYPDQVCVFNVMTTGTPNRVYMVGFSNDDSAPPPNMTCNGSNGIILRGKAEDNAIAMIFEGQLMVATQEGKVSCRNGVITVQGSKQFTAVVSSGTNFKQDNGNAAAKFSFKGPDPHAQVTKIIKKAFAKTFDSLRSTHVADYKRLYNNFKLSWNAQVVERPTDVQVAKYRVDANNPYLEWLVSSIC